MLSYLLELGIRTPELDIKFLENFKQCHFQPIKVICVLLLKKMNARKYVQVRHVKNLSKKVLRGIFSKRRW